MGSNNYVQPEQDQQEQPAQNNTGAEEVAATEEAITSIPGETSEEVSAEQAVEGPKETPIS